MKSQKRRILWKIFGSPCRRYKQNVGLTIVHSPCSAQRIGQNCWEQRLPFWNLMHLHSYSIHVLLLLYPVLLLTGGFHPQVGHIRWVLAFLCATATPIFFFLNDPQGNAMTAFFARCFGERLYLLGFLPALAEIWVLLYLPWYKAEQHRHTICAGNQITV